MSMRNLVVMTVKVSADHIAKLNDIARHDTLVAGRMVSRSNLVRKAIAKLIAGRKATLYNDPKGE